MKLYRVEVKDDGEFHPVKFADGQNVFENRADAVRALEDYRNRFPYRITLRVRMVE